MTADPVLEGVVPLACPLQTVGQALSMTLYDWRWSVDGAQVWRTLRRGVGIAVCRECGGDGDAFKYWGDLVPDMEPDCVPCKGTGWRFVSI